MSAKDDPKLVGAIVDAWYAEYEKYGTGGVNPVRVIDRTAYEAGVVLFQGTMDECLAWIDQQCARAALAAIDASGIAWVAPWEATSAMQSALLEDWSVWEKARDACLAERRGEQ